MGEMAPAGDTQGRERERLYMREWHRARREERIAAGLCVRCGAPLAEEDAARRLRNCAPCREYGRAAAEKSRILYRPREEQERAERQEQKRAKAEAARNAPGAPFCPHCGGRDVKKGGREDGKQKYICRGCRRSSYGRLPLKRGGDYPCPNFGCGGNCRKHGRDKRGRQLYHCPRCGRVNTRLYPSHVMPEGGPFPFRRTFYLSLMAARALDEYVQKHTISPARALRAIFRRWADEPVVCVSAYPRPREYGEPVRPAREDVNTRLPDLRRQALHKRMAGATGSTRPCW